MRWIWIDKFVEFTPRTSATAIKNVSLAEEHLHDLYPGYPVMPASLIIEGLMVYVVPIPVVHWRSVEMRVVEL